MEFIIRLNVVEWTNCFDLSSFEEFDARVFMLCSEVFVCLKQGGETIYSL